MDRSVLLFAWIPVCFFGDDVKDSKRIGGHVKMLEQHGSRITGEYSRISEELLFDIHRQPHKSLAQVPGCRLVVPRLPKDTEHHHRSGFRNVINSIPPLPPSATYPTNRASKPRNCKRRPINFKLLLRSSRFFSPPPFPVPISKVTNSQLSLLLLPHALHNLLPTTNSTPRPVSL